MAKIALFGVFRPVLDGRVQPFIGTAWIRDGSSNPKRDLRQLTMGATGPVFQTSGPGYSAFTLLQTLQLSRRIDAYGTTDGLVARAHFDLAWGELASGSMLGGLAVLPHVAGLWERRTEDGPEKGNWRGVYVGAQLEKPFELGEQRFKASALARKLYDTAAPAGNAERRSRILSVSLDYYFYDPADKSAKSQPSLFLTRERGTDFLEYSKAANKTTAGFRLKFN